MECRLVWHEQFQRPFVEVLEDSLQTLPEICASYSNFLSLLPLYCSAYAWLASLASARFKLRSMLLHSTHIVLAQNVSFQQQPILLCGSAARGGEHGSKATTQPSTCGLTRSKQSPETLRTACLHCRLLPSICSCVEPVFDTAHPQYF